MLAPVTSHWFGVCGCHVHSSVDFMYFSYALINSPSSEQCHVGQPRTFTDLFTSPRFSESVSFDFSSSPDRGERTFSRAPHSSRSTEDLVVCSTIPGWAGYRPWPECSLTFLPGAMTDQGSKGCHAVPPPPFTFLLLWRDTKKAYCLQFRGWVHDNHGGEHEAGSRHASAVVVVAENLYWISKYKPEWGRQRKRQRLGLVWAFEITPSNTPPPTRLCLLILPK